MRLGTTAARTIVPEQFTSVQQRFDSVLGAILASPAFEERKRSRAQVDRGPVDVDHFIPWSRYPEDGLANLVVAHKECNNAKRDFLAATHHVVRWADRLQRADFARLEDELQWNAAIPDMRGVARGIYLRLPQDALLWVAGRDFNHPQLSELQQALS